MAKTRLPQIQPGHKFGHWEILEEAPRNKHKQRMWLCKCGCAAQTERVVLASALTSGHSTSCGCARKAALTKLFTTHGLSRTKEYHANYNRANADKMSAHKKKYLDVHREAHNARCRDYRLRNKATYHEHAAARRARKLQATPGWDQELTRQRFLELSRQAKQLYKDTGVVYHIDHIIPLKSSVVCGLHVHNNLQLLPASANISKGNKFKYE